jgi:hypothetical protein
VTRAQGEFSLRMFHRSWGITMIQHNISAPCTVLDFPTRERFARELTQHKYDVVGITGIIVNLGKVREMCRMVREISPRSTIVVGGHVAAVPGIERTIAADHIVRGEGIRWMRGYLGEDVDAPIQHPAMLSAIGMRSLGLRLPHLRGGTAATIIPSVGCPMGCNFCTTSAFFGGKGKSVDFYRTGAELFEVMSSLERSLGVWSFFVMDENFLLHRERALRLRELMKQANKSWALYVFSSVNAIRKYTMKELVELGISWIWMGLESPHATYAKLDGADTQTLARELRAHGIKLLGSTIVGMEHHTPENLSAEIEYAVAHETDFHQFMLYTPVPGTPLYAEMQRQGRMLDVDIADTHGQDRFNFRHPAISREESKRFLDAAFARDFERNGPSIFRICATLLAGWKRYGKHPDARIRRRFQAEVRALKGPYAAALWAMERRLATKDPGMSARIAALRREIEGEFGWLPQLARLALGPVLLWSARREANRLAEGKTHEPPTIVERRNWRKAVETAAEVSTDEGFLSNFRLSAIS